MIELNIMQFIVLMGLGVGIFFITLYLIARVWEWRCGVSEPYEHQETNIQRHETMSEEYLGKTPVINKPTSRELVFGCLRNNPQGIHLMGIHRATEINKGIVYRHLQRFIEQGSVIKEDNLYKLI